MIWIGTVSELLNFFDEINQVHPYIKFDYKYSIEKIEFLDTTIFKNEYKSLSTKLYSKPTDRPGYIHSRSYHPRAQIKNVPYGQALRVKRICTEKKDFHQALTTLKNNFISRGYNPKDIVEQFERTTSRSRKELLTYKEKKNENKLKFTTIFNYNLPAVRKTIGKNWETLQTNERQAQIFKDKPIIAFKRNRNLKDIIGGTRLMKNKKIIRETPKQGHCGPCLTQIGNICCQHILSTNSFKSASTGEKFLIRHHVNCRTRKGIYLATCKLCPHLQYVGKFETQWSDRLYNHRKDAKKRKSIPYDEHFQLPNHDFGIHAKFIIIETLKNLTNTRSDRQRLEEREDFWVSRLKTMTPNGFNDKWNSPTRTRIQRICT